MVSIAHWVNPPVSRATLSRYRLKILTTAVQPLRNKGGTSNTIKAVAAVHGVGGTPEEGATNLVEQARATITKALEAATERRARWIADAEERYVTDELGNVIRIDGKPLTQMDHRALAAHDRNNLSAYDMQAKMAGAYPVETGPSVSVSIALLTPQASTPGVQVAAPASRAVDAEVSAADAILDIGTTR